MQSNSAKRGWSSKEDQIILQMVAGCPEDKRKWVDVSKELLLKTGRSRTGKQCRERWQHQIDPSISREEWSEFEIQTLFQMQAKLGNKWAKIAAFIPGRSDNAVKNFFYSSVRRVFAKINLYMAKQRVRKTFKTIKYFESDYMSKLMAVVDGKYQKNLRLTTPETLNLAKEVLFEIANLVTNGFDQTIKGVNQKIDSQILMMHQFRKCCKKRKQNHYFNEYEDQGKSNSLDHEQPINGSSIQNSQSAQNFKGNPIRPKIKQACQNYIEPMELVLIKNQKISETQNSLEECFKTQVTNLQIKKIDSFCHPISFFKAWSGMGEENNLQNWSFLGGEYQFKQDQFKIQQQNFEYRCGEEFDIFSMPLGYREDCLSISRYYGQVQDLTKFKMFEASLALDQCLLKARSPSFFEQFKYPEYDF